MINQGLKSYTKQISRNIGRISYHINPNKECANLILDIVFQCFTTWIPSSSY